MSFTYNGETIYDARIETLDAVLTKLGEVQETVPMNPEQARTIIDAKNSIMDKIEEYVIAARDAANDHTRL